VRFLPPAANMEHDELGGDRHGHPLGARRRRAGPVGRVERERRRADRRQGNLEAKWRSFHERGGVSAGTLFHEAKRMGWVPEPGLFLYARDKELASQPHPAQGLIDRMMGAPSTTAIPSRWRVVASGGRPEIRTEIEDDPPERPTLPAFTLGRPARVAEGLRRRPWPVRERVRRDRREASSHGYRSAALWPASPRPWGGATWGQPACGRTSTCSASRRRRRARTIRRSGAANCCQGRPREAGRRVRDCVGRRHDQRLGESTRSSFG
jgi:hypothetical protein